MHFSMLAVNMNAGVSKWYPSGLFNVSSLSDSAFENLYRLTSEESEEKRLWSQINFA